MNLPWLHLLRRSHCRIVEIFSSQEAFMRTRIIVGVVLVMALFCVGTFASRAGERAGQRQWTIVNFIDPVQIQDRVVMGPVLIVHDDEKMAHGEACTSFYRFDTAQGPQEEVASFHCQPEARPVVQQTTFTYTRGELGCQKLVAYQIAGDAEAHRVPVR
jgi:hypothetical protein